MPAAEQFATLVQACCAVAGTVSVALAVFRVGRRSLNAV